jgi:outer membrane lipoprotein SlyB
MLIEVMPRTSAGGDMSGGMSGGSMGSSGAAGATGSSATSDSSATGDRVYRVTLRMDDGSTRIITQETTPDFRSGDRVNLSSGAIGH